jgi:hypothetical protein
MRVPEVVGVCWRNERLIAYTAILAACMWMVVQVW